MPLTSAVPMQGPGIGDALELGILDPLAAFRAFEAAFADVVWLDSSAGGTHVIGTGSRRLVTRDGATTLDDAPVAGDALAALAAAERESPGLWIGWLGYETGVRLLGLEPPATRFQESAWLRLDRWIVVDADTGAARAFGDDREGTRALLESPVPARAETREPHRGQPVGATWAHGDDAYRTMIDRCLAHIHDGDSYLMCLTTAATTGPIDAAASYERLRAASPVRHGGFVRIDGTSLACASPELFVRVDDGIVVTQPIKGTRRRGAGADDARLARELQHDEKERAENVMIVDLCRNDVQRVCAPGTVATTSLFAVESYASVHQLVSTVEGRLLPGRAPLDAVRALFPAGSMTGAPKRSTVELLGAIEGRARGVYSGCFGFLAGDVAELAMVIRGVVADEHGAEVGVGGGITALSDPAFELDEVHLKARATLAALVPRDVRYASAPTDSA